MGILQNTRWMPLSQLTDVLQDISRINSTWDDIFSKDDAKTEMVIQITNTAAGPLVRLIIPD